MFKEIISYRSFIYASVKRDFTSRYSGSILGALWSFIQPLSMIVVYTVIFAEVMRARLPGVDTTFGYSIYLCSGILTWGYFVDIVSRCQNVYISNANLIKKLSFPKACLPIISTFSASISFGIVMFLFLAFLLIIGDFPYLNIVYLPILIVCQVLFAVSFGLIVGFVNVFFRDAGQFTDIIVQFWFWFTPIVYPISIIPERFQWLLNYNPMYCIIDGYQNIFVFNRMPNFELLLVPSFISFFMLVIFYKLFAKYGNDMVDEL
ncbi:ABC transporter permease [Aeromonas veronii]